MGSFRGVELAELELRGERLVLRRWRAEDAPRVHAIMQDRSMYDFLGLPDPYTLEAAQGFVTQFGHEGRDEGTGMGCAVVQRSSGQVVGSASIRVGEAEVRAAEIGYWVAPNARGQGYGAEATRLLRDWAFGVGVRRLRLLCDVRNLASVRVALAAGFRFEGIGRAPLAGPETPSNDLAHADLARFGLLASDSQGPQPLAYPRLPPEGLRDDVLHLRVTRPKDSAAMHAVLADELSMRWDFTSEPRDPEVAYREATASGLYALVGPHLRLAMVDNATGAYAGDVSVRRAGPPQIGGIGYAVHPAFRGRGYTTRALRLLVPWAFDVADFARLELGAKQGNVASQRSAANAGFEPDGIRRARLRNPDGSFGDEVRYALINPRYR